jgi:hypothetical protein
LCFSDIYTIKSKFAQNLIYAVCYQLLLTVLSTLFLFTRTVSNVTISLNIMSVLTIISFFVWIIAKNRYKNFKYHFPIK